MIIPNFSPGQSDQKSETLYWTQWPMGSWAIQRSLINSKNKIVEDDERFLDKDGKPVGTLICYLLGRLLQYHQRMMRALSHFAKMLRRGSEWIVYSFFQFPCIYEASISQTLWSMFWIKSYFYRHCCYSLEICLLCELKCKTKFQGRVLSGQVGTYAGIMRMPWPCWWSSSCFYKGMWKTCWGWWSRKRQDQKRDENKVL